MILFNGALVLYIFAMIGYLVSVLIKRVSAAKLSTWILLAAFVLHGISLGGRAFGTNMNPAVNLSEALSFLAWIIAGVYLIIQWHARVKVLGIFVAPVSLLLMIGASSQHGAPDAGVALLQHLRGVLVTLHVILSISAEAFFAIAGCAALVYLIQNDFLKHRRMNAFSRMLPALGDMDRINRACLLIGFPLLTLGIIAGSMWARVVWGSNWSWDPKQVWTLATWMAYAVLLHQRLAIGWSGRKAAIWSAAATALMFFGLIYVNAFHTTTHRFG